MIDPGYISIYKIPLAYIVLMWYNALRKEFNLMEESVKKPISEAKKRADAKYHSKFQQVKFYCEPELYEAAKAYCAEHGESLTAFIKRLMRSEIGA